MDSEGEDMAQGLYITNMVHMGVQAILKLQIHLVDHKYFENNLFKFQIDSCENGQNFEFSNKK